MQSSLHSAGGGCRSLNTASLMQNVLGRGALGSIVWGQHIHQSAWGATARHQPLKQWLEILSGLYALCHPSCMVQCCLLNGFLINQQFLPQSWFDQDTSV